MKDLFHKIRTNFKRRNLIQLAIMTVCFAIGCGVCYVNEIEPRKHDAYTIDPIEENEETDRYPLTVGETITQEFIYTNDQMIAAGPMLYSDSDDNAGRIHMALYDADTGELLGESDKDVAEIENMEKNLPTAEDIAYAVVGMPTIYENMDGRHLRYVLTVEELSKGTRISILANPWYPNATDPKAEITGAADPQISILIRGYCYHYNFWGFYFAFFATLLYLMLLVGYFMIFVLEGPLHRTFILAGIVLAMLYQFLLPPVSVPDELVHITTSYYYSNDLLGIEEPENLSGRPQDARIYVRSTDLDALSKLQMTADNKEFAYLHWNLFRRPSSTDLVMLEGTKESDNWTLYATTTLGVTLGRLLGLNGITTLYLGRFFAFLLYLLVFYAAIRIIPVGKAAVFVLATCPMVLQQCCSFSYDALPIEMAVLFFCGLIRILFYQTPVRWKEMVFLCVTAFLLASCKGGVYVPFCLCVFLIPKEQFGDQKKMRIARTIFVIVILAGFAVNTLGYLLQVLHVIAPKTATQTYTESLSPYSISDIVLHPLHTLYLGVNTILVYADFLIKGMISGSLSWMLIEINPAWIYFQYVLLFLGVMTVRGEKSYITRKQRIAFGVAFLLMFIMTCASMLISWTPVGNTTVRGLQGRYFTPLLLPLIFIFRGNFFTIKENVDGKIAYLQLGISVVVVYNILTSLSTLH